MQSFYASPYYNAMTSMRHMALAAMIMLGPVSAQDFIGNIDVSGTNDMNIDRFAKPVFGFRAQREPELRRLRMQAGRPVLHGRVDVFDITDEELETALNARKGSGRMPKISCDEVAGEVVCVAK